MQLDTYKQIRNTYRHVYLSPHLDDAALSCGGLIAVQCAAGEATLVITICSAPPDDRPYNAVAQEFHGQWKLTSDDIVGQRKEEDRQAMAILGCDFVWAERLDAIYRCPEAYVSRETLFAPPIDTDPLIADMADLIIDLRQRLPHATFYAPLGVGNHVDHLILFDAVCAYAGVDLAFYEDVHYVMRQGALEQRLAALPVPLESQTLVIDSGLDQRIAAIAAYESQVGELFGGVEAMARQIRSYAERLQPAGGSAGERIWRRTAERSPA
ncbi:MAG TPA: PIG-L family deacetylase [Roseiflexaceae bacterium]|nr:PIG-L family deacetylase [Roseiflexaceae bacterium]HMP40644.1 PIG-L family deacetylase [Roseiflexaceae bacterium]